MAIPERCPLCSAAADQQSVVSSHVYGGNGRHAIFVCGACDLRYLHPGLTPEQEAALYAKEFESFMANRSAEGAGWEQPERHIRANEDQRVRRMTHLQPFLGSPKRVLEVGCSSGFMLYSLMDAGHECVGVEPSGVFSEYVRSRGLPCHDSVEALRQSADAADGFDLILHYYVMEHVADPVEFLSAQLELLRPGGVMVFEVPNATDALTDLYQVPAYERFIWVLSHRWYFSTPSLSKLLSGLSLPFEVRQDQRYDLSNHLVWARDGRPGGMGRFTEAFGPELEDAYKTALIRAGRGDTLIGVIRR